jgi:Ca2+-binding RTX toxin-like protein
MKFIDGTKEAERIETAGLKPDNFSIHGREGNDTISGGAATDFLFGDEGDDFLAGCGGADLLDGGEGSDRVSYIGATSGVRVSLATGGQTGDAAGDQFISIEHLEGSDHADWLQGDGNDNDLRGHFGADELHGGFGKDTLNGGADNDTLFGGAGADVLKGGAGSDVLFGGGSSTGSDGQDVFVYTTRSQSTIAEPDLIMDFRDATDLIDLSQIDAVLGQAGNQSFSFVGDNQFTAAGQIRAIFDETQGKTIVQAFDGINTMQIDLAGKHELEADNFVF